MQNQPTSIEAVRANLEKLRQNPSTRNRFPRELWASIIQLTKNHPIEDICAELSIVPAYLKRKIQQSEGSFEFRELTIAGSVVSESVTIEISANDGLKAKVTGPLSCLDYLQKLLGR